MRVLDTKKRDVVLHTFLEDYWGVFDINREQLRTYRSFTEVIKGFVQKHLQITFFIQKKVRARIEISRRLLYLTDFDNF